MCLTPRALIHSNHKLLDCASVFHSSILTSSFLSFARLPCCKQVSLSNLNVYACLICGKYYQGLLSNKTKSNLFVFHLLFWELFISFSFCLYCKLQFRFCLRFCSSLFLSPIDSYQVVDGKLLRSFTRWRRVTAFTSIYRPKRYTA